MKNPQPTLKQPKSILVATIVPWIILTGLAFLVIGVISGYFIHVNIVGDAKAEVLSAQTEAVKVVEVPKAK